MPLHENPLHYACLAHPSCPRCCHVYCIIASWLGRQAGRQLPAPLKRCTVGGPFAGDSGPARGHCIEGRSQQPALQPLQLPGRTEGSFPRIHGYAMFLSMLRPDMSHTYSNVLLCYPLTQYPDSSMCAGSGRLPRGGRRCGAGGASPAGGGASGGPPGPRRRSDSTADTSPKRFTAAQRFCSGAAAASPIAPNCLNGLLESTPDLCK